MVLSILIQQEQLAHAAVAMRLIHGDTSRVARAAKTEQEPARFTPAERHPHTPLIWQPASFHIGRSKRAIGVPEIARLVPHLAHRVPLCREPSHRYNGWEGAPAGAGRSGPLAEGLGARKLRGRRHGSDPTAVGCMELGGGRAQHKAACGTKRELTERGEAALVCEEVRHSCEHSRRRLAKWRRRCRAVAIRQPLTG